MRLIFEGPDGSGKSTLQEFLRVMHTDHVAIRLDKPSPDETEDSWHRHFRRTFCRAVELHEHLLFSRCHISDPIYGKMLRDRTLIAPWRATQLNMLLRRLGFTVVFCTASVKTLQQRLQMRGLTDDYDRRMYPRLRELAFQYEKAYHEFPGPKLLYDSDVDTPDSWVKTLPELPGVPRKLSGVGNPFAGVVLVGDRFSGHYVGRVPPPASPKWNHVGEGDLTVFDHGGSSRYLMERLSNLGLVDKVYILNSHYDRTGDIGSRQLLQEELRLLQQTAGRPLRIVALGNAAEKRLLEAEWTPTSKVPHPQSWRRFHHNDRVGYAKLLKEACLGS